MQNIVPQSSNCLVTCSKHHKNMLVFGHGGGYAFRCPVDGCKCKVHLSEYEWKNFMNSRYDNSVLRRVIVFNDYIHVYFKQ